MLPTRYSMVIYAPLMNLVPWAGGPGLSLKKWEGLEKARRRGCLCSPVIFLIPYVFCYNYLCEPYTPEGQSASNASTLNMATCFLHRGSQLSTLNFF